MKISLISILFVYTNFAYIIKEFCMNFISVKDASNKFNISERRIQKLCEENRIPGCTRVSGIWLIPDNAQKPIDERLSVLPQNEDVLSLSELCKILSISVATGRNWVKLGKLTPKNNDGKTPYFDKSYVDSISADLKSGTNNSLKSRRNKNFVSGNSLYNSYVSEKCKNLLLIQNLLEEIKSQKIDITEEIIAYFLADCALHLIVSKSEEKICSSNLLIEYLTKKITLRENKLIDDFILNKESALNFVTKYPSLFKFDYIYENNEDVLGLLYISCKNIGSRKATGSYYTPTKIVKRLISSLLLNDDSKILDPCCGTGNFLLQLPKNIAFENIYGTDIDSTSVKITRLNMALRYPNVPIDLIFSHIFETDYLMDFKIENFSIILGNPPWGANFSDSQKKVLRANYKSTTNSNIESYDVFIEKSLQILTKHGQVSFVLPEALLNVKAHSDIRKIILNEANIKEIKYLGNVFDGVQCPSIIFRLEKTQNHSTAGMFVDDGKNQFEIKTERNVNPEYFSFLTNDDEYKILQKIKNAKNCTSLLGNADFALGIVTGNNKKYISSEKQENNERVLKGADIYKYRIKPSNNFIDFQPEKFQQVAPTKMYRAKEKLFYRFISNQLIFAYDNRQMLSLNSCNIVIPKFSNLNIKYIMSILNSRVAQFIFQKEFNSIKVLRSHIENIPIPVVSSEIQDAIVQTANSLILANTNLSSEELYDGIDKKICELFGLSNEEQNLIKNAVDDKNKFLP